MTHSIPNSIEQSNIPYGYCHCGCGQKTNLVKKTNTRDGVIKGTPYRFVVGHNGRQPRLSSDGIALQPGTRAIPLTQGKVAIVDAADFKWLSQWKWSAHKDGKAWYARRQQTRANGRWETVLMHRLIIGAKKGELVDHKNMDGLDNRRANLRIATRAQNGRNRGAPSNNKSGYKGVRWHHVHKRWYAGINIDGKETHIGHYGTAAEAARAYDHVARREWGEFAVVNFPEDSVLP